MSFLLECNHAYETCIREVMSLCTQLDRSTHHVLVFGWARPYCPAQMRMTPSMFSPSWEPKFAQVP
jgi:hypothetical protein